MSLSLNIWTHPTTGEVRVYANAFREYNSDFAYVAGGKIWFGMGEDGKIAKHFRPCMTGNYGRAAKAVYEEFGMEALTFPELVSRIRECLTKSGNFSQAQYYKKFGWRRNEAA